MLPSRRPPPSPSAPAPRPPRRRTTTATWPSPARTRARTPRTTVRPAPARAAASAERRAGPVMGFRPYAQGVSLAGGALIAVLAVQGGTLPVGDWRFWLLAGLVLASEAL